jgi:thiol-disulfide isomerase/thioredoxin
MKRILLVFVGLIILILIGFGFSKSTDKNTKSPTDLSPVQNNEIIKSESASSRYIEYSQSALQSSSISRRVLFFYANWCETCRPADQNFKANLDKIPKDVTVIRINYNDSDTDQEEKDLAKKYNVTYQHTFVQIDRDGNEVTKWNGGKTEELLKNII